jgi:hypothetical protein
MHKQVLLPGEMEDLFRARWCCCKIDGFHR